jgi:hypothetical protein
MLHAFARHKSKAYTRYLGVRDPSEPRVSAEDEITSIIFGPLDFLSASDNWKLWKAVLQNHASTTVSGPLPSDYLADFFPDVCTLAFWPRKNNIEPDLVVTFSDAAGQTRSLLVELKWDAPPSGEDQLKKQWLAYQAGQHAYSLHVFITKRIGDLPTDVHPWSCEEGGNSASRLRAIRWNAFRHEILKLAESSNISRPLKRWCELSSGFLRQVEIRPFVGFHTIIRLADAIPDDSDNKHLTWWRSGK